MTFSPQEALQRTIEHREIFFDEMVDLMRQVMRGEVSPVMTAAILTGLRVKKETVGEIAGAATVMRELALAVPVEDRTHLIDIVGTGGDGSHTFNISTCAMFVVAAAGAKVAKHGKRKGVGKRSAPMRSKRWARSSNCVRRRWPARSVKPASASCSRRCITPP